MRFDVLTLFFELFVPFRTTGVLGRAVDRGLVAVNVHDLRAWSGNRWGQVDDEPYGGGAGMVLTAPPLIEAVHELAARHAGSRRILAMSPRGRLFDQSLATELTRCDQLILLCGRYEGFDERAVERVGAEEVSLGDFVLGGGEVAAMAVIEAVSRLVPGVVGDPDSVANDSFSSGLLDHPCYTRPPEVDGCEVPPVLLSGHHEAIRRWRLECSVALTVTRRPDLIKKYWGRYPDEVRTLVRRFDARLAAEAQDAAHTRDREATRGDR